MLNFVFRSYPNQQYSIGQMQLRDRFLEARTMFSFSFLNWMPAPFRKGLLPWAMPLGRPWLSSSIHTTYLGPADHISHFFTPSNQKKGRMKNHLFKCSLVQDDQVVTPCTFYANTRENLDKNLQGSFLTNMPRKSRATNNDRLLFLMLLYADTCDIFIKQLYSQSTVSLCSCTFIVKLTLSSLWLQCCFRRAKSRYVNCWFKKPLGFSHIVRQCTYYKY